MTKYVSIAYIWKFNKRLCISLRNHVCRKLLCLYNENLFMVSVVVPSHKATILWVCLVLLKLWKFTITKLMFSKNNDVEIFTWHIFTLIVFTTVKEKLETICKKKKKRCRKKKIPGLVWKTRTRKQPPYKVCLFFFKSRRWGGECPLIWSPSSGKTNAKLTPA